MKKIKLNLGQFALVDDEDYEYLMQWKWFATKIGNTYYVNRNTRGKDFSFSMHRLIMNTPKSKVIDHIDGNALNNQKSNLRECSQKENLRNRKKCKDGSSNYKGVSWHKGLEKWRVRICVNYKQFHLGVFEQEKKAAEAYDAAARKYFGKFARLNNA